MLQHSLYTRTQITIYMAHSPCFLSPLADSPLLPFPIPLYLLGNPPSCDRIRPPWSPIACKLNSPFPFPCSYTPNSKIPTPPGFLTSKYTFIRMASWTWLTRSSTKRVIQNFQSCANSVFSQLGIKESHVLFTQRRDSNSTLCTSTKSRPTL